MKRRILPFAFAGAVGFVVDAGILLLVSPVLGPFGGRALSFSAAVLTTWLINRNLAFADKAAASGRRREFLRYFLAMLPGAAINWLAYAIVVALLPTAPVTLALAVAAGAASGLSANLFAADRLAFRKRG